MAIFSLYLPLLQQVEGGFQKNSDDPGNYNSLGQLVGTNYGISARFFEGIIGRPPTEADMRAITKGRAEDLFRVYFWNKLRADEIRSQAVANTVVDHHINSGRGVQLAQSVLNIQFGKNLAVDNIIGSMTLGALNSVSPDLFVDSYNKARAAYYSSIGNSTFLKGWLVRLKSFAVDPSGSGLAVFLFFLCLGGSF